MDERGSDIEHTFGWRDEANRRWVLEEDSREKFEVVSWAALPTFTCPHCHKDTEHPPALLFDSLICPKRRVGTAIRSS